MVVLKVSWCGIDTVGAVLAAAILEDGVSNQSRPAPGRRALASRPLPRPPLAAPPPTIVHRAAGRGRGE